MLRFSVEGKPIQQGSMRYIGNGRMIHNKQKELMEWRSNVASRAKLAGAMPSAEPIILRVTFRLQRPKTVKRIHPTTYPDLDKLIRSILDSLSNVAYLDDSQVIDIHAKKVYSDTPGADIEIEQVFDDKDNKIVIEI